MHVHSNFSIDAIDGLHAMCLYAIKKGLKIICFTEHLDFDPDDPGFGFLDYQAFSEAVDSARQQFGDRIEILKGVECGEPHLYPHEFEVWQSKDLDYILGSVHTLDRIFIGESRLLERYTLEQLFELYYEEVLKAVRFGGFDCVAHLDFPKRYYGENLFHAGLISEILTEMVRRGIALEINTSPRRKALPDPSPSEDIVRRYLGFGGTAVTIGSDAHKAEDIGSFSDDAFDMVKKINPGFAGLGIFKKRKFISL